MAYGSCTHGVHSHLQATTKPSQSYAKATPKPASGYRNARRAGGADDPEWRLSLVEFVEMHGEGGEVVGECVCLDGC